MKRSHKLIRLAKSNVTIVKKDLAVTLTSTDHNKSITKPHVNNINSKINLSYYEKWCVNDKNVEVDLNAINQMRQNLDLNKNSMVLTLMILKLCLKKLWTIKTIQIQNK